MSKLDGFEKIWVGVIVLVLLALLAGVFGGYYYANKHPKDKTTSVTTPTSTSTITSTAGALSNATSAPTSTSVATSDVTAGWKTYTNTTVGYSIKYPSDWIVKNQGSSIRIQNKEGDIYASNEGVASSGKIQGSYVEIASATKTASQTLADFMKANLDSGAIYIDVKVGQYSGLKLTEPTGLTDGIIVIDVANGNTVVGLNLNVSKDSEQTSSTDVYNNMLSTFQFN